MLPLPTAPRSLEIRAGPDSARGHSPKPALTLEESCSSSCYSIALGRICRHSNCVAVCFGGGKEGHRCVAWKRPPPMHSQPSTKATLGSLFPWECSSFAQAQGVYPEQDSDLREIKDACSSHPCWVLQVQSNMNKTQYFWWKEKYTHGTASGGFLKLFKGKWKGWWLPLGEHLQLIVSPGSLTREEEVWWQKPLSHRPCSLYCTPTAAPGRNNSCLQLDPAPLPKGPLHTA